MTPQARRVEALHEVTTWVAYCLTFGAIGTLPVYVGVIFSRPLVIVQVALTIVVLVFLPAVVTGVCLVLALRLVGRKRCKSGETFLRRGLAIVVCAVMCGILVVVLNGIWDRNISHLLWPIGLEYFVSVAIFVFSPFAVLGIFSKFSSALIAISIFALGAVTSIVLYLAFGYL